MGLLQRLELRQGQALAMTPQLLQAIKLLQLSHVELAAYVEAELERNPLLERAEAAEDGLAAAADDIADDTDTDDAGEPWLAHDLASSRSELEHDFGNSLDNVFPEDAAGQERSPPADADSLPLTTSAWSGSGASDFDADAPDFDATLAHSATLHEHLQQQFDLATREPRMRLIGRHLIDAIDGAGYLNESLGDLAERLGASLDEVEQALAIVQSLEPAGVGARSLAECLAIQLRERNRLDPAMQTLLTRLDLVARRDLVALRRLCGVDAEDLAEMLAEIRALDPKPGRAFDSGPIQTLVPDVFVRAAPDGSWHVELNPDTLPRVLVNQTYYARVSRTARNATEKAFLTDCLQSANWLSRSLEQRARTVLKVATEIVRQQDGFFAHGVAYLRPLNLKAVAEAIGMHESTVSRVTANKSIGTSRGTFEMKYFFTAAIPGSAGTEAHSAEAVRHRIKQLIDAESPENVLSDDTLVQKLKGEGIDVARRTVAKYRESLRIPSSVERRRAKQAALAS